MTRSASNIHAHGTSTPSFRGRAPRVGLGAAVVLLVGSMLPACAGTAAAPRPPPAPDTASTAPATPRLMTPRQQPPPPAATITRITLEHDCHGCPSGTRLELQRGGMAVATVTGKARHRTEDRHTRAALPAAEFDALVQRLLAEGFFEMAETYEDEGLADGAWATLTVQHSGGQHQVFRREGAGPAGLKNLEAALAALQARLRFGPDTP